MKPLMLQQHLDLLKTAWKNRNTIAWKKIYRDRLKYPDYALLPFPFDRNSKITSIWQQYFEQVFGSKVTYPCAVRILNSYVLSCIS